MEFHPLIPQMKYETNERTNELERIISRVFDFSNSFQLCMFASRCSSANVESVAVKCICSFVLDPCLLRVPVHIYVLVNLV